MLSEHVQNAMTASIVSRFSRGVRGLDDIVEVCVCVTSGASGEHELRNIVMATYASLDDALNHFLRPSA